VITLVSVPGTGGAPIFESFPAGALTDPMLAARGQCWGRPLGLNWRFFFVTYPAAVFPMEPSWRQGIENTVGAVQMSPGFFVLDGYSQGATVVARVWRDEILNPAGRLHNRLNDCLGVITYGPPLRSPGLAFGNTIICGIPVPPPIEGFVTGGIAGPDCLTAAQCYFPAGHPLAGQVAVYDHAAPGDLYGSCPIGTNPWAASWKADCPIGYDENLAYGIIQNFTVATIAPMVTTAATDLGIAIGSGVNLPLLIELGVDAIEAAAGAPLSIPATGVSGVGQLVGLVVALVNGGMFLIQGTAPHGNYDSGPATGWLIELGKRYA
jgi:hypothetical protein